MISLPLFETNGGGGGGGDLVNFFSGGEIMPTLFSGKISMAMM